MNLIERLSEMEKCMNMLEVINRKLSRAGFHETAKAALTVQTMINQDHYELIATEGPVVQRRTV